MIRLRPRLEWMLLLSALALVGLGAAFIYSATSSRLRIEPPAWHQERHVRQLMAALLGLALAGASCLADYRRIARWAPALYLASLACLALALFQEPVAGVRRWIPAGPVRFQPSELAKLALILLLSQHLASRREELGSRLLLIRCLLLILAPFLLVAAGPDLGSAAVLLPAGAAVLYAAGIPARRLLWAGAPLALAGAAILYGAVLAPPSRQFVPMPEYQKNRIRVYLGLDFAPPGAGPEERREAERERRRHSYNIEQAMISVGSGGLAGKGWRQGTQSAWGYLPRGVAHNDFIFSVIAEEAGFAGSAAVLALYGTVILGGLLAARRARGPLGRNLAAGVSALWFCHVFVNIGMNIRIVPVTGLPLPLLSDGGTSALCFLLSLGLVINVHLRRGGYRT